MLRSDLCDLNDAYIIVKGTINVKEDVVGVEILWSAFDLNLLENV